MSSNPSLYDKTILKPVANADRVSSKMYRGFSTVSENTENYSLYDYQLIQQDILNHFYIKQGERLMNPTFGTIIWDLIFEPLTDEVKSMITRNVDVILNSDPRVKADQIIITPYESGIQIECLLTYVPYNVSQVMQLKFDQNNGLIVG
jgi:phage baseplate assembly protein W